MGSDLERYLAQTPEQAGPRVRRFDMESLIFPLSAVPFFKEQGLSTIDLRFKSLPEKVKEQLREVEPAVLRLGDEFDYGRLSKFVDENKAKLTPEVYTKMSSVAALGQARQAAASSKAVQQGYLTAVNELGRQLSVGRLNIVPKEELEAPDLSPQGQGIAKAVGAIAGIALSGKLIISALSKATLLPKIGPAIGDLPRRVKEVMLGVGTGAILDVARPDGLPEDPASIDLSARLAHPIKDVLGDSEAAERVSLAIAGGAVGGGVATALLPVFRGIQYAREVRYAGKLTPETEALIRAELQKAGVAVEAGATKRAVVAKMFQNMDKVSQTERMAVISAADETRMDYVLNQLYTDPAFKGSDDLRYMAGVFRANPGGISVVKGVADPAAAEGLTKSLGLNVVSLKAGEDMILMRPQAIFPEAPKLGARMKNQVNDFTDYVRALGKGKPSTQLSILPDGTIVRGNYNPSELVNRFKLKAPIIDGSPRNDLALREHFRIIDVQVGEGGLVTANLPSTVTQRQATALGRMADRGPPQMIINSATPGKVVTLEQPFGVQVEDAMAGLVGGATKPKITADMVRKVQQYQREGVFEGQAGVLPDGYPVEVMRKIGGKIAYRDPITGAIHKTPEENISILPTSLEGELKPSRQIFEAMDPGEQKVFAELRRGINEGLTKPITTIRELESFASARGKLVSPLGKGKVRVFDPTTGESHVFDTIKAAVASIRGRLGPLPDLTPPEIEELLGFKPNFGAIGGGGPPARLGEAIPITEDEFARAVDTSTLGMLPPGMVEQFFVPTKGLMTTLSKKYNMPFDKVFDNLQSGTVHRQNFVSAWVYGAGPGLPEGAMPLQKIYRLAGKPDDGRQRLITAWLESEGDDVARRAIEAQLRPNEIKAAGELRKLYGIGPGDGLFKTLDVEAEYLTSYAPHLREHAEGAGNNLREAWRVSKGTPLPRSVEFFADHARDGTLNVYEDRAFIAAAQYIEAGARSRFLNQALADAKRLVRAIPDNAVKNPLVNYVEALRGSEFTAQRAALDASFSNLLRSLGATEKVSVDIGERMSMAMLGLSYQATMAFRPGLAIRNATQIFQTTWPLLGRLDDGFAEAIGRALTVEGRNAAIRAGAVTVKQNAIFAGDEAMQALPGWLRRMSDTGFKLYDGADTFTRSVTFHVAKLRSDKAISTFGEALKKGTDAAAARRALIKDSGAMALHKTFVDEYLRRVATSPEGAGEFLGKQMADVTQFLYGRGNQPRWMRTVPGRFFGQFGTWPLWYVDYVRRSFMNMWRNGYQAEALQFVGKIALVDAAIFEGGRRAKLDLRRWMAGNALFGVPPFGQPPAVNALYGLAQLSRGMSEAVLGSYDSPANKQRLAMAQMTLKQAGLAFVPNLYAVRDIGRLLNASSPTEAMAAALATRPTTDFTVQQRLDLLFAPGRMSTDIDLEEAGDPTPTAVELLMKGMEAGRPRLTVPQGNLPSQPPEATSPIQGSGSSIRAPGPAGVQGRPPLAPTALPPSIRSGESKPNLQ